MPAEIVVDAGLSPVLDEATARRWLQVLRPVLDGYGDAGARLDGVVCVRLCGETASRELNRNYRQRDKPTNVLSFPADVVLPDEALLGDLAICLPVVEREAREQGKTYDAHLAHLFLHGVLHLLGFDHATGEEAAVMEAVERAALAALDIADPYEIRVEGVPCQAG